MGIGATSPVIHSIASNIKVKDEIKIAFTETSTSDALTPYPATSTLPAEISTSATQRIGMAIKRETPSTEVKGDISTGLVGESRVGSQTLIGDSQNISDLDQFRQGKNVVLFEHYAKKLSPTITINAEGSFNSNGTIRHGMHLRNFGQGSLFHTYDDITGRFIPFEDFPGRLDPVQFIKSGDYIMQYMIVTDFTRNMEQYIEPDNMDGVIEVFEIRKQRANTSVSDIQIQGIKADLSTGDWNFDQKGSTRISDVYEKVQSSYDHYFDAQDVLFADTSFSGRSGNFLTGSNDYARKMSLPGYISEGVYKGSPYSDTDGTSYLSKSALLLLAKSNENILERSLGVPNIATNFTASYREDSLPGAPAPGIRNLVYDSASSLVYWATMPDSGEDEFGSSAVGSDTRAVEIAGVYRNDGFSIPTNLDNKRNEGVLNYRALTQRGLDSNAAAIVVGDNPGLSFQGVAFTISFWMNQRTTSGSGFQFLFEKEDEYYFSYRESSGAYQLSFEDESNGHVQQSDFTIAALGITAGKWHHVVITHDGTTGATANTTQKIYVDGFLKTRTGSTSQASYVKMEAQGHTLVIGADKNIANGFDGEIAEFAMWTEKAFSADEVEVLYNAYIYGMKKIKITDRYTVLASDKLSEIGTRYTGSSNGLIFSKNVVSASNVSGIMTNLGKSDSIAFGGFLK